MAVVTHGSSLPDSSQKADFYAIVDNATVTSITGTDISAGAAIADTQLATISTAGKVNTSSLTGQIANANLAQLTTAALVSGAALTLLANVPSGAGILPVANVGAILGTFVSKTLAQVYQAATDGFVVCYGEYSASGFEFQGFTDNTSGPTITVSQATSTSGTQYINVFFPVIKNNYYKVTSTQVPTVGGYFFIPLGS